MNNPIFKCEYRYNGQTIILEGKTSEYLDADYSVTEDSVKLTLIPKAKVELVKAWFDFHHEFKEDDKFFANGYQSWTTSREYTKKDTHYGINKLAKQYPFIKLSGTSSDVWFCEDKELSGVFRSHCYTYVKNGEDFFFLGSLSEKQAYTIYHVDMNIDRLSIAKDVEGLTIEENYPLYDIVILRGNENYVFDKYFELMGVAKPKIDHLAGYTSWYNYFQKIDQDIIYRDLEAMDSALKEKCNIFQIDDGYETFVGDWLDPNPAKFPNGMKYVADKIHDKGYLAGIWIAPFSAQRVSRVANEHPDWLIKDAKGKPLLGCQGWCGAYTLDFYHTEAREYIKNFFNVIVNEWGFDMVKLDFLYSEAMFPRHGKTRGTIMCEAMDFLRECVGEDKLILGCGVPLGPSFGVVDACRIGCDVSPHFEFNFIDKLLLNMEIVNTRHAINNTFLRRHLDQRVFCNDPDVFFLRDNNLKFTKDQKLLLAKVNNLFGSVLFVSDNAGDYDDETTEYLKLFFKRSEAEILSAEYVTKEDVRICYIEDGKKKTLRFNVRTGKSNLKNLL